MLDLKVDETAEICLGCERRAIFNADDRESAYQEYLAVRREYLDPVLNLANAHLRAAVKDNIILGWNDGRYTRKQVITGRAEHLWVMTLVLGDYDGEGDNIDGLKSLVEEARDNLIDIIVGIPPKVTSYCAETKEGTPLEEGYVFNYDGWEFRRKIERPYLESGAEDKHGYMDSIALSLHDVKLRERVLNAYESTAENRDIASFQCPDDDEELLMMDRTVCSTAYDIFCLCEEIMISTPQIAREWRCGIDRIADAMGELLKNTEEQVKEYIDKHNV